MIFQILDSGSKTLKEVIRESFAWYGMKEEITSLNRFSVIPEPQEDPGASPCRSATHPHRYTVLATFHHALFDGLTSLDILQLFMRTLHQVLDGRIVDDSVKKGVFESNEYIKKVREEILANEGQNMIVEQRPCKPPVILKGFSPPGGHTPTTNFIFKSVEPDALAIIKSACKREGVTFHTALMAGYQSATMELLQASGVQENRTTFCVNMSTDLRRYMAKKTLPIHGLHAAVTKMFIDINNAQQCGFWDLARNIEREKTRYLSSQEVFLQMAAAENSYPGNEPPPPTFDYGISALWGTGADSSNIVQVTGPVVYGFLHNSPIMSFLSYTIYRGRYAFTFSYASDLLAEKTAVALMDKTFHILQDKCRP